MYYNYCYDHNFPFLCFTQFAFTHESNAYFFVSQFPPTQKVLNVQPEITDLFLLELNVTVPNYSYSQLVILVIEGYALNRADNRIVLSRVFLNQHDHDVHIATHPAMFQVIICRLWLGLSRNCLESKLSRERAKNRWRECKLRFHLNSFVQKGLTMSSGPSHECRYGNPSGTILFNIISISSLQNVGKMQCVSQIGSQSYRCERAREMGTRSF